MPDSLVNYFFTISRLHSLCEIQNNSGPWDRENGTNQFDWMVWGVGLTTIKNFSRFAKIRKKTAGQGRSQGGFLRCTPPPFVSYVLSKQSAPDGKNDMKIW